jgi:anti-sigma B factor antagonist
VNLRGRLDAAGARAIEAPFYTLARTQYDLLVDLSRVTFVASLGLRLLIAGARILGQHGGRWGGLRPDTAVEAVLISSGTDMLIPVFADLSEAIRTVCGSHPAASEHAAQSRSFALQVPRSPQGTARVGTWVDELASDLTLAGRAEYALGLCLEEAVNLILGSTATQAAAEDGSILLRLIAEPNRICVTVQDRGAVQDAPGLEQIGRHAAEPVFGIRPETPQGFLRENPHGNPHGNPPEKNSPDNPAENPPDHPRGELDPLGGSSFGLGLMRQYAREVTWSRLSETNRLTMIVPR